MAERLLARHEAVPFIDAKAIAVRCYGERFPFLGRLRRGSPRLARAAGVEFLFANSTRMLADGHKPSAAARRQAPAPPAVQGEQARLGIVKRGWLVFLARQAAAPATSR